jgi:hypothetical protein
MKGPSIMADTESNTEIPELPEPYVTSVKLYELATPMLAGDLRDALQAAQAQLHAYANLRSAVQHVVIDAEAGELRTPVDLVRELRAALDATRTGG